MGRKGRAAAGAVCAVMVPGVGFAMAATLHAPAVQSGYAPVNGLRMYYEVHGSADGKAPPLVLLHGGGSTIGTSFGKVLPALAATRQVVAFEQQGHGHTADIADRPFTFEQSADDAAALLRHLGIGKADFFGYSNGGHIALEVAIRHPDLVRKLVVESAMFDRDGSDPGFWKSFENAKPDDMPRELREAYLAVAPHPEQLPTFFAKSVRRMMNFKGWTPEDAPVDPRADPGHGRRPRYRPPRARRPDVPPAPERPARRTAGHGPHDDRKPLRLAGPDDRDVPRFTHAAGATAIEAPEVRKETPRAPWNREEDRAFCRISLNKARGFADNDR